MNCSKCERQAKNRTEDGTLFCNFHVPSYTPVWPLEGGSALEDPIDLTPSPAAYKQMLETISVQNPNPEDRAWAVSELERCKPAFERGSWSAPAK